VNRLVRGLLGGVIEFNEGIMGDEYAQLLEDVNKEENFCDATSMLMAMGVLYVGIILSLQSSAGGSKLITTRARKYGNVAKGYASRETKKRASRATAPAAGAVGANIAGSRFARLPVVGGAWRAGGLKLQQRGVKVDAQRQKDAKQKYKDLKTLDEFRPHLKTTSDPYELAEIISRASKIDNKALRAGNYLPTGKISAIERMGETNPDIKKMMEPYFKMNPDMAYDRKKAVSKLGSADIPKLSVEALENPAIIRELKEQGKESTSAMRTLGRDPEKMSAYNRGMDRYVTSLGIKANVAGTAQQRYIRYVEEKKKHGTLTQFDSDAQNNPWFAASYNSHLNSNAAGIGTPTAQRAQPTQSTATQAFQHQAQSVAQGRVQQAEQKVQQLQQAQQLVQQAQQTQQQKKVDEAKKETDEARKNWQDLRTQQAAGKVGAEETEEAQTILKKAQADLTTAQADLTTAQADLRKAQTLTENQPEIDPQNLRGPAVWSNAASGGPVIVNGVFDSDSDGYIDDGRTYVQIDGRGGGTA